MYTNDTNVYNCIQLYTKYINVYIHVFAFDSVTDLRQLACELSLSRYISPQKRIMLITLNAVLKKILTSSNLININNDLKVKLYSYYQKINSYLKR